MIQNNSAMSSMIAGIGGIGGLAGVPPEQENVNLGQSANGGAANREASISLKLQISLKSKL